VKAALNVVQQIEAMEQKLANGGRETVTLRRMTSDDIPFAHELRKIAGWNQTEQDWRGYLTYDPEGCFVAEVSGKPAGTATTIRYGDRFGWIGMVLVHPDFRRLGLGTRLLRHTIERLQSAGVRCVKLDATPMGKKVYVPLGFVDEYEMARYDGIVPTVAIEAEPDIVPFAEAPDFPAIVELDARAFGAERANILRSLSGRNPDLCFVAHDGEVGRASARLSVSALSKPGGLKPAVPVAGFIITREGASAVQIGPWIARSPEVAKRLLAAVFARIRGRRLFVDVIEPNAEANAIMRGHGFSVQRTLTRMFLGRNEHPGNPKWVFGVSSPEKG
jgi:ribosomal protein S18 acetylase RimI-like enzyme